MINSRLYSDANYIGNLFRGLARSKDSVVVHVNINGHSKMCPLCFKNKKGTQIEISDLEDFYGSNSEIQVSFIHKNALYTFDTLFTSLSGGISIPSIIEVDFRRVLPRHTVNSNSIELEIDTVRYPVIDISTQGLKFSSNKDIRVNSILNAKLHLLNQYNNWFELDVSIDILYKTINNSTSEYGVKFVGVDWRYLYELFKFILRREYPSVQYLNEFSHDDVFSVYNDSGYLNLKDESVMLHNFQDMYSNIDKLSNNHNLANSIGFYDRRLLTTGSILRVYDNTFLGQQLAFINSFNISSKLSIYFSLSDFALNNPDFKYYLTYYEADLEWSGAIYKNIGDCINDSNKFIYDELYYFESSTNSMSPDTENEYEVTDGDIKEFCEYLQEGLESKCYNYCKSSFDLESTKRVYQSYNIYCDRKLLKVCKSGVVLAYIVAEVYSDGLNLFNLLDMSRVYYTNSEYESDINILYSALPILKEYYRSYNKSKFNIFIKADYDFSSVTNLNDLTYITKAGRTMINKDGVLEFKNILSVNTLR